MITVALVIWIVVGIYSIVGPTVRVWQDRTRQAKQDKQDTKVLLIIHGCTRVHLDAIQDLLSISEIDAFSSVRRLCAAKLIKPVGFLMYSVLQIEGTEE